jgi:uncharacterized membrane protein YidH (DUF202 family)
MTSPIPAGVQGERTRQAWTRTSLATLGIVGVGLRLALDRGAAAIVVTSVALLAAAGFGALARVRAVELGQASPPPLRRRVVLGVTAAVVVADVAGLVLLLA